MTRPCLLAASLVLAACGQGGGNEAAAVNAAEETADQSGARASLDACPFESTTGWGGAIEGGRLEVNGRVDLMMAGMRPTLTERPGAAAGTLALDLALTPEANAAVNDHVTYQRSGGSYRRGEIWCGGERIADFAIVMID